MSLTNIIIGLALGTALAAVCIALWRRYRDVFAVIFVIGIAALAIAVTVYRVHQYRSQSAADASAAQQSEPPATFGDSTAPAPPPVMVPVRPPLAGGPTGAAAPQAAENPFTRKAR